MVSMAALSIVALALSFPYVLVGAFRMVVTPHTTTITYRRCAGGWRLFSSIGGGDDGDLPPNKNNGWNEFLDPSNFEESEHLLKAREYMNENSLPISFGQDADEADEPDKLTANGKDVKDEAPDSSALVANHPNDFTGGLTPEMLARNPYMAVVSKLSPSDLIAKFTNSAHPRVQNAVRTTILGLIGGLPKMAFDTTTVTTGQKLASLMFQLQMTGYMFKNAEYRLSLSQSLGGLEMQSDHLLPGMVEDEQSDPISTGKVKGNLRVKYGEKTELEVDAAAYMSELRSEVKKLQNELVVSKKEKEETVRKDLLAYIRTLPQQELQSLTNTMSQDVLVAMKGLVNAVISGIGEGQIGPQTVTEQSGEAMAQLCMWQLVIGYNLRTLEVREEMRKSLTAVKVDDDGVGLEPGALE